MIRYDVQKSKYPDFERVPYKNNQMFYWRQSEAGDENGSSIDSAIEELEKLRDNANNNQDGSK